MRKTTRCVLDEDGILYCFPYGKNGPSIPVCRVNDEILQTINRIETEVAEELAAKKKSKRSKA